MLTVGLAEKSKGAEIKTTNEVVLAVGFHPTDANILITCGKSHIFLDLEWQFTNKKNREFWGNMKNQNLCSV